MKTSMGGTGPYIIFRNYGAYEGWEPWKRYETPDEAIEDILTQFSEEIILVKEVELIEKEEV